MPPYLLPVLCAIAAVLCMTEASLGQWRPKQAPLMTRWAGQVSPDDVLAEYPRPQMVRDHWLNLNGLWDFAITGKNAPRPEAFDRKILVPFCVESALSSVMDRIEPDQRLWYRRTFRVPADWAGQRLLLHVGAADWETHVYVNGQEIGQHRGGYDPFSFDITDALTDEGEQEIVLSVWDPTNTETQPVGKQSLNPRQIWYTATSGIWQTVWLEPVPKAHITSLEITPDVDAGEIEIRVNAAGGSKRPDGNSLEYTITDGEEVIARTGGPSGIVRLKVPDAKLWSPDSPHLYGLKVRFNDDTVRSYFGMRKIAVGKDEQGITRILLNGEPLFQYGLLDQGYWPDGIYTAPTDEALRYDLELAKRAGFNMVRKHVKVAPARWYYHADRLGLLVWQDMPSGGPMKRRNEGEWQRPAESAEQFERELVAMIDTLRNHPSLVMWMPFNEGWGQYDTARITDLVREQDPSRLITAASGWNDMGTGDIIDFHLYPLPTSPKPEEGRAAVLGEFGGLELPIEGHLWQSREQTGYAGGGRRRTFETPEQLTDAYLDLLERLAPLTQVPGLSAAVYTQMSDVEAEVNGLITYDRAVVKMDPERLAEAHRKLIHSPPTVAVLLPSAMQEPSEWHYTTRQPDEGWVRPEFDASDWETGTSGFGKAGTPGSYVKTPWTTRDLWLRRTFTLDEAPDGRLFLLIHHDDEADVYLNGQRVAGTGSKWLTSYTTIPLDDDARQALGAGENTIALHARQRGRDQYTDVGLLEVRPRE